MSTEVIPVRMYDDTQKKVKQLQEAMRSPSRSDAIRRAVEISNVLVKAIEHGDRVLIEDKHGKQRQILITGLSYDR